MSNPFVFHIADLRSGRAEPRDITAEVSVDWRVELSRVLPEPPLRFTFGLSPIGGGIAILGDIEATVVHTCHRCLDEWEDDVVRDVAQMITTDGDEDDDYLLEGDEYDFEIMVRDELLLNLPISPLCAPECEGLVAEAGSGLNTDLSEDEVNERSPFSVLKDLLDTGD
ncbi:MAG: DUF177 domain-containing protein [Acidimicrobiia bacterium]|nr:DUF177 domain-containing protein [Acidimicrobiia bacterium]MDX2467214.1 DUF177 domain-containing protein [Acidimicrobiia bacterium]